MHTDENQNNEKKTWKNKGILPGQQVASNRAMHCNMQLFEDSEGEYYPVIERLPAPSLIRGEYHPIANGFQYPKVWGRKYAAKYLLEYKIKIQRDILAGAEKELAKLERCLNKVEEWSDTDE